MTNRCLKAGAAAALVFVTAAAAQTAPGEIDAHIQTAKAAAGLDFRGTFVNLCLPAAPRGGAAGGRGAAAPGAGLLTPRPAPDRGTWYASPYKVFDNLYWLGTRQHSSWALKTRAGLVIIEGPCRESVQACAGNYLRAIARPILAGQ
jgi:metallo-beta-lactamase class B